MIGGSSLDFGVVEQQPPASDFGFEPVEQQPPVLGFAEPVEQQPVFAATGAPPAAAVSASTGSPALSEANVLNAVKIGNMPVHLHANI